MSEGENLRVGIAAAERDAVGRQARRDLTTALCRALRSTGSLLWVEGYVIGTDRVERTSPFDFGDDAKVGLSTVMQIGNELIAGAVALLDLGNQYAAAALLRQLVEVEYLAWAFGEDEEEARSWLRSSAAQRQNMWQPRHLRARSGSRFRARDYAIHCNRGGHPTPDGRSLLPDHVQSSPKVLWADLAMHGTTLWDYFLAALEKMDAEGDIRAAPDAIAVAEAAERWRQDDPLPGVLDRHDLRKRD